MDSSPLTCQDAAIARFLKLLRPHVRALIPQKNISFNLGELKIVVTEPAAERLEKSLFSVSRSAIDCFGKIEILIELEDGQEFLKFPAAMLEQKAQERYKRVSEGKNNPRTNMLKREIFQVFLKCENTPYPALVCRLSDGKILYANSRVEMYRYRADEVIGSCISDYLYNPDDWGKIRNRLNAENRLERFEICAIFQRINYWLEASFERVAFNEQPAVISILRPT